MPSVDASFTTMISRRSGMLRTRPAPFPRSRPRCTRHDGETSRLPAITAPRRLRSAIARRATEGTLGLKSGTSASYRPSGRLGSSRAATRVPRGTIPHARKIEVLDVRNPKSRSLELRLQLAACVAPVVAERAVERPVQRRQRGDQRTAVRKARAACEWPRASRRRRPHARAR